MSYSHLTISTDKEAETHVRKFMEEVENKNQSQYIEDDDARSLDNKYLDWYFRFGTLRHFVMLCRDMAERCVSVYQLKRAIRNLESSYVTNSFNQPELKKMAGSSFIQFVCLPPPIWASI